MYDRNRLKELIKQDALKFGDFTLASGKKATYYLDCRKLTLDGEAANLIAAGILEQMQGRMPDSVGGMAIGADPISAAVITCAWQQKIAMKGFIVRKAPKEHGTGQLVEGPVSEGQTAVMMEDVVTTGGSSLKAIRYAREHGLVVDRLISIVDRGEKTSDVFAEVNVEYTSLFHVREFLESP